MLRKLFPLAIGGLALGSTEFILMGLLRNIGSSMSLSDAQTGHFIAAYALGVVFGAPTLVALSSKYNPKRILMGLMLLFTIFNGISALMPDYYSFLVARFFSGLPHGAFFGVGAIIGSQRKRSNRYFCNVWRAKSCYIINGSVAYFFW